MKLRIPQAAANEALTESDIASATTFAEIAPVTLYKGAAIHLIKDTVAGSYFVYTYAVGIDEKGDLYLSQEQRWSSTSSEEDALRLGRETIDQNIKEGTIIEQANEDLYLPDFEEMFLPQTKQGLLYVAKKNAPTPPVTVAMLVDDMLKTGGKFTYTFPDGHTEAGYIIEIYYDYTAHKLRARTNDGYNGVANVAFPNDKRVTDAVYLFPAHISYTGKNYRVTANMTMHKIR